MKPSKPNRARRKAAPTPQAQHNTAPPEKRVVTIEKPIYGGAFLAREEGKAIFVPLTLPGEQARVRIVQDKGKRGYATAEVEEILIAAPQRVLPGCRHFAVCGGCQYQHASYVSQLDLKLAVLRETLSRGGVPAPAEIATIAGEPWGYRNRIRVALDVAGNPGYRGRRSHAIVSITECPIAAPILVRAALAAAEIARQSAAALRPTELALFCDADETAVLLSLFVAQAGKTRLDEFAAVMQAQVPALAGIELVVEGPEGQQPRLLAQWGAASLTYHAAGSDYRVDHGAFFQVNRWLIDALVDRVTVGRSGTLAWDLFAGVGLFARRLTSVFSRVVAVESAPSAASALDANLKGTTGTAVHAGTLDFLARNRKGERPDLIVVDPPRTGLGPEITSQLAGIASPALVYVSCDPATLARDLRALLESGYAIESITLADLFPQTFHLETVVHLRCS
jgi:23S rRNA (uracil1939-C5)-methyltransferase